MKKPTDGQIKNWLNKHGEQKTVYRWDYFGITSRAKVRARVKAAILAERKGRK